MKTFSKIIIVLFLCTSVEASAQNSKSQIGFKLLPGLTKGGSLEGSDADFDISARFTFNFGLQYILTIKDSSSFIETGIYYVDRGAIWKDGTLGFHTMSFSYALTGDYYFYHYCLSLPILFRKELKHFYFSAGVTVDYHLKTTVILADDKIIDYSTSDQSLDNLEFGLAFNIGTQIKLSKRTKLFIEGGFHPSNFEFEKNDTGLYWNYLLGTGLTFKL